MSVQRTYARTRRPDISIALARAATYTEITIAQEGQPVGDYVDVSVCGNCGYIELDKEKKK